MATVLLILHLFVTLALIGVVLLQRSEMTAALDDLPSIEDEDGVCTADRGEAMGDRDRRSPFHQARHRAENLLL